MSQERIGRKVEAKDDTDKTLSASLQGAGYLVLLQLSTRAASFILNLILLRLTSSRVLGVVSVELELILSTILFLSREAVRMATLRASSSSSSTSDKSTESDKDKVLQRVVNMSYVSIAAGCTLILIVLVSQVALHRQHMYVAVGLYCFGAFLELLSEPMYVVTQLKLQYNVRVRAEATACVIKSLATLAIIYGLSLYGSITEGSAIIAFAAAQSVNGLVLLSSYWYSVGKFLTPKKLESNKYLDYNMLQLSFAFAMQSIIKHLLTEGDKIVLVGMASADDMGVYAYVLNYGSLIARILFSPIEETMRNYFSKTLNTGTSQQAKSIRSVISIVVLLLKTHIIIGMAFIFFGTTYSSALVSILGGRQWILTSAPLAFAAFCLFVPFMGVNGITEGFMQSVASEKLLHAQTLQMIALWLIFFASGWVFVGWMKWGAVGLIFANMVNVGMRIYMSSAFIKGYIHDMSKKVDDPSLERIWSLKTLVPRNLTFWVLCGVSWVITVWSEGNIGISSIRHLIAHISVGVVCFVITFAVGVKSEEEHFMKLKSFFQGRN
ncbi:hypothetical protein SmJEL517_g02829 [Synchytrium microbalum]|uniref:Man(5)GlcNAc(2)-PP-dolichol translocation protein RFT1 n=1 Tax=Synchytrium microbalum TaxID=1806994 RepID=A0A507CAB5_9FUNG|nr:uncharacterized protein SmJEL517_g02829 [Synchytrium microbalum]TPX34483.1 hypothetical protein SmJEL517_g02829 [Synchytrium microbalum]